MIISFEIAGILLSLNKQIPVTIEDSFLPFLTNGEGWTIQINDIDTSIDTDILGKKSVVYSGDYQVIEEDSSYFTYIFTEHLSKIPYGITRLDKQNKIVSINRLSEYDKFYSELGNCLYHSRWEKIMSLEGRIIMHAACVHSQYDGILFSGPSGIGKSTQAKLWCDFEHAELINGDRTILSRLGIDWRAYGSPYAGSSRCYKNQSCKVRVIVMLRQGNVCKVRRLSGAEAFQNVFSMMTVYSWDEEFVTDVCNLVETLIREVPILEMVCTPDIRAITVLKKELEVHF